MWPLPRATKTWCWWPAAAKVVRFKESKVRVMGRTARGVRGMKVAEGEEVIALMVPQEGGQMLAASESGYGKRTGPSEFPTKGRGTQGVIGMVVTRAQRPAGGRRPGVRQ